MSDPLLDRVIATCREPVAVPSGFERRVLEAVRDPRRSSRGPIWTALGLVAAVLLVLIGHRVLKLVGPAGATVRFEVTAPRARSVTLVGDFNDWNREHTALLRPEGGDRWSVTLSLPDGIYRYAFLVDGTSWMADPARPEVRDPDFGTPLSVVAIGAPAS